MEEGILNGIAASYSSATASWLGTLQPLAQRLFLLLATIELIASGAEFDTLEVRVHVTRFSAGRDFELGLAEQ